MCVLQFGAKKLKLVEQRCFWEPLSNQDVTLEGRSRHCSCYHRGSVFTCGGTGGSESSSNETCHFDIMTGKWSRVPCIGDVPPALSCSSITSYDEFLWLFGGCERVSGASTNILYRLVVGNNTWQIANVRGDIPCPRNSHTMATCDGNMFLFGGWDGESIFGDMFVLHSHGTGWSEIVSPQPSPRPCARMGHSASVFRNSMFIFGGFIHPNTLNDLWEFNTPQSRWEKIEAGGQPPSDRYRHSSVVIDRYLIIYGGINANRVRFNEVSCFDIMRRTWFNLETTGSIPCARSFHQAAAVDGAMYVFGGVTEGGEKLSDTHRLITPSFSTPIIEDISESSMEWKELSPRTNACEPRTGHVCFMHENELFVFGGSREDGYPTNEMRVLDLRTKVWRAVETTGDLPPPFTGGKAAAMNESIFLFGGSGEKKGVVFNDLYHFSIPSTKWTRVVPTSSDIVPPGRSDHTLTLVGEDLILFGGVRGKEILNDCLRFSLLNDRFWTVVGGGSTAPSARFGHTTVAHGPNRMVVFGGWDGKNLLNDVWLLDTGTGQWMEILQCPNSPRPRYRHSAVVVLEQYMCIFGGVTDNHTRLNELFLFDLLKFVWTRVCPATRCPIPRTFHEAVSFSQDRSRLLVFGGRSTVKLNDTWTFRFEKEIVGQLFTKAGTVHVDEEVEKLRKRVAYLESRVICKVCMENEINAVLIPCAHRCACLTCASVIVNRECICPICRETIQRLVQTIDA